MAECQHNWVYQSETATSVTHKCSKCGATYTRAKGKMSRSDVACLLFAVAVLAATLTPFFFAARVAP